MLSRRTVLAGVGAAAATLAAGALLGKGPLRALLGDHPPTMPIRHIIIACQENRSFDHYLGYAPRVGGYGPVAGYTQPDGRGGNSSPYHLASLSTPDIPHSWQDAHEQWHGGAMDGFYINAGSPSIGYYTEADLPFYYGLIDDSALCVNYFSSVLGPTHPNRFYLVAGTSGGVTTNRVFGRGILDYPMILDLLEAAGISWKVYNIDWDGVSDEDADNVFGFWRRWSNDPRIRAPIGEYFSDLEADRLPGVSWVVPEGPPSASDEHPPSDISIGMGIQQRLIDALRGSSAWDSSAYVLMYDEHGGFFDHVSPPVFDAYGAGVRVPAWLISPFAKRGHLEPTIYEHASILKFIERVFGLPTLASVNHRFDERTPGGPDNEASSGNAYGPPAPPRDGRKDIGDLFECFDF